MVADRALLLLTVLNSYCFDFFVRLAQGGTHLSDYIVRQVAVPRPEQLEPRRDALISRALELTYTASDLNDWADDAGATAGPFQWDGDRRFVLRCEIDALIFDLYGMTEEDVGYVMDTFPIVRRKDEQQHGEYRTKRMILDRYRRLADKTAGADPFMGLVDPPPADPRLAHGTAVARA
jgi:hypothetical protein